ncbi:MAG TPA: GntR family transcriptional regulator [Acetobacteraceae bacterium]|jgi:DNA-binding GntR family transcriptional regulator
MTVVARIGTLALADVLRRDIAAGRYGFGAPLREAALEAQLGCTREVLRDVLLLLERQGLAVQEKRRGWRVRGVDGRFVRQLYAVRALLERHAVAGMDGHDVEPLLDALTRTNAAMAARREAGDVDGYLAANLEFHAEFLRHAPNDPLRQALDSVNILATPLRRLRLTGHLGESVAVEEHASIIDILAGGQTEAAADAMHDHIMGNLPATLAVLDLPD